MGGYNSGRHSGKRSTDSVRTLDVRRLSRDGLLRAGGVFSWTWTRNGTTVASIQINVDSDYVTLTYSNRPDGGEWQPMCYAVLLTWTTCHYGGQRAWWLCPATGCGRRVAVLYSGAVFTCRHCQQLAYKSQRENSADRLTRQVNKLRARLGWKPGIFNKAGGKPKGLHWKTFWQLRHSHDIQAARILAGLRASLGMAPFGARPPVDG